MQSLKNNPTMSEQKGAVHFLIPLILLLGLVATVWLVQNPTRWLPKAFNSVSAPISPPPVSGPISTPIPEGKTSPCNDFGDVDQDGLVTDDDAQLVLQIVAGLIKNPTNEQKRRADVNPDSEITSVDALKIKRYVQGYDSTFPSCTSPTPDESQGEQ